MNTTRRGFLAGIVSFALASRLPKPKAVKPAVPPITSDDLSDLNAALTAGYSSTANALRVESLEATLMVLTFNQSHIKLWRDIPKLPAFRTEEVS